MRGPDRNRRGGFTLAELLVAMTLLTVVMSAVYVSFGSIIRAGRQGEANLATYQDARTATSIMVRELNNVVSGSGHLFEGTDDEFEFYAVTSPMDVDESTEPRVLWIRYHVKRGSRESGPVLIRQEADVKSALPVVEQGEEPDTTIIDLSPKRTFELASGVRGFDVSYYWVPRPDDDARDRMLEGGRPPKVAPVIAHENRLGWGLPQGVRFVLALDDTSTDEGVRPFDTFVVFRGPTDRLDEDRLGGPGGVF